MVRKPRLKPKNVGLKIFHRELRKFRQLRDLDSLARRLFQKDPQLLDQAEKLQSYGGKNDQASRLRSFILKTVERQVLDGLIASQPKSSKLPIHVEDYISFCHLFYVARRLEKCNWTTIQLKNFPEDLHQGDQPKLPVFKIRKRLKMLLESQDLVASVKMDISFLDDDDNVERSGEDDTQFFVFRIVTIKKSLRNTTKKGDVKLLNAKPIFLVYYPGEPYVYIDSTSPNPIVCQTVAECFFSSSFSVLSLTGKYVHSLRRLRMNKDLRVEPISQSDNEEDPDDVESPMPRLSNYGLNCVSKYMGFDELPQNGSSSEADFSSFAFTIQFQGSDVLNALSETEGILDKPFPNWLVKSGYRGRNFLHVRQKALTLHQHSTDCNDAASDFTMLSVRTMD